MPFNSNNEKVNVSTKAMKIDVDTFMQVVENFALSESVEAMKRKKIHGFRVRDCNYSINETLIHACMPLK